MRIITDWHLHSRFSRACSQELTLENNALWCAKKGVNILGTADFTHPTWFKEITEKLIEDQPGLYKLKSGKHNSMRYMMTTEVSQIYKKNGKTHRIHNIIMAPSTQSVAKINSWLDHHHFNRRSDGRPILGIDSEELYKYLRDIDERIIMIPAHAWTPWYSVFGAMSGFDSLDECYGSMTPHIYAIETGLSSNPPMNRSLSKLDNIMLISNSDAHSPRNFGREANVFEIAPAKLSYDEFIRILRERDSLSFKYTIEFYPEEGKYFKEVSDRISILADRKAAMPSGSVPFKSIVPLQEIIAESLGLVTTAGKKVQETYESMIKSLGSEFDILLDSSLSDIASSSNSRIAEAINRVRTGNLSITPGHDGIYGKVKIFGE